MSSSNFGSYFSQASVLEPRASRRFVERCLLCVAGLALGTLLLPSASLATPADYQVSVGRLKIDVVRTTSHGQTRVMTINLLVSGGQFTYDTSTGALGQLAVTSGGKQVDLSQFVNPAGSVQLTTLGQGSRVLLRAGGISLPAGSFSGNIRLQLLANRIPATAPVVPVGPGNPVPEPAAALLFGGGLLAAGWGVRRKTLD